jgi:hypothetical protein
MGISKTLKDGDGCRIFGIKRNRTRFYLDMLQGWSHFFVLTQEDMDLIKKYERKIKR